MDILVLIGRILFALLFLLSAFGHLTKTKAMAGYAASKGLPAAGLAVAGSGLLLLAGGLSLLLGVWADLGALLLAVFLVLSALTMHRFWQEAEPMARQQEMTHFQKDIALAGACLMLIAFFSYVGHDLGLTLTGPLFDIG
ncbi:DoxX family membrane protein [Streptomyces sp. AV19]|uniref:DoxX family membrane protein n=1 Tax=Streptomyces sp. AV19 TaxID=2793068 RepID=UPI0018FE2DD6|nr:DoxX family membrane protein [Streptomyces sp. AV19]MBH1937678.1 DoxX family membrane protein [Streptomyces sp. AV19]MDG4536345.1 DoxX family membrane protein [Streptomyces sp. AV19]